MTTITAILAAMNAHNLRSTPTKSLNNPNLSDFTCTCQRRFVACDIGADNPPGVPSMAGLHIARELAADLGIELPATARVETVEQLDAAPAWAAIEDANGLMAQRNWLDSQGKPRWVTQHGGFVPSDQIALPAVVVWVPELHTNSTEPH